MFYTLGIDPGKKGGIAHINGKRQITVQPMPSAFDLSEYLGRVRVDHVCLEKSQAMPGQGVSSMFNYGEGYGMIQGLLIAKKIPFTLVTPQRWQKVMLAGVSKDKATKARALEAANRVFTKSSSFWLASSRSRKPHDGMIDSALIAEYCRRLIKD